MVYQTMKSFERYQNTLTILNDCQQTETKINQRDIPCFRTKYTLCTDLDIVVTSSRYAPDYIHLESESLLSVSTWCSDIDTESTELVRAQLI